MKIRRQRPFLPLALRVQHFPGFLNVSKSLRKISAYDKTAASLD